MPELNWAAAAAGIVRGLAATAAVVSVSVAAHAGGYDTGERDWDFLFQQGKFAVEASTRYIDPQRTLKTVSGANLLAGQTAANVREAEAFTVERFSVMAELMRNLRCMGSYRQPFEGHANYGTTWFAAASATEQHFTSEDYGLTCALSTPFGMGNLLFIGGASYETVTYELLQNWTSFGYGPVSTNVSDDGVGWRAGIGYEIPQYALRATLIYNSAIDYTMTGTGTGFPAGLPPATYSTPLTGSITMPQSVELRAQSGVAPGWLAFGSIKWANWSVDQNMPLCPPGTSPCVAGFGGNAPSALTLLWRDTWTVTLGAAHQFSKAFSLAGSLTWDQGASQGFTSQTDTWSANLTGVWTPNQNFEVRVGGTIGVLTGGSLNTATLAGGMVNSVGYNATFGDDLVYSLSASAALHY